MDFIMSLDTKTWVALAITVAAGASGFTIGIVWFQIAPEEKGPVWWYKGLFALAIGACFALIVGAFAFAAK